MTASDTISATYRVLFMECCGTCEHFMGEWECGGDVCVRLERPPKAPSVDPMGVCDGYERAGG